MQSTNLGSKISLSAIVKGLNDHGDHGFSESTIYKVSIPRKVRAKMREDGVNVITHIMVEASFNVFDGEPAITIFLRDVTHYVEV